jgi:hypothetical protein
MPLWQTPAGAGGAPGGTGQSASVAQVGVQTLGPPFGSALQAQAAAPGGQRVAQPLSAVQVGGGRRP